MATSPCPTHAQLHLVVEDTTADEEFERLVNHVEQCERCGRAVEDLLVYEETLAGLAGVPLSPPPIDATVEQLKQRLHLLHLASSGAPALMESASGATAIDFLAPAQQADELGRLGNYRILQRLGAGGMGLVLLAEDVLLQRKVALKIMLPRVAAGLQARIRFLREAQAVARIEHKHIVTIHQVGEDNGVAFLAMPLLKGESLDTRLERVGCLNVAEAARIAAEMAEGLAAAHAEALIHRDIKPSNVWLEQGGDTVKLLDFGLARLDDGAGKLTHSGVIVGTPAFMAPEQARGETVDARADLFSLGCVLYQMLTGVRPFRGNDTLALLSALALHDPRPPHMVNPKVPPAVSALTMRLLAKNAAERPASAADVAQQLRALSERLRTPVPPGARPRRWPAAAGVVLMAGVGALIVSSLIRETGARVPESVAKKTETTPLPVSREKPFVLARHGSEAGAFKTFPGLWEAHQPGDEIVVYGKGPFPLPALEVQGKTLVLKAGPGFSPQFVPDESLFNRNPSFWLTIRSGELHVENCDFLADGRAWGWPSWGLPPERSLGHFSFARAFDSPCVFRGCRMVGFKDGVFQACYATRLTLEDCLVECGKAALAAIVRAGSELILTNNLIYCGELVHHAESPGGQKLQLKRNAIAFAHVGVTGLNDEFTGLITVTAEGNLFDFAGTRVNQPIPKELIEKRVRWHGEGNCYAGLRHGLAAWNAQLPKPEINSSAVPWLPFGWRLDMLPEPDKEARAQRERLQQGRRQTGLDDLGPDLSMVGPGDAYVRSLASAGRAVPQEQMRPEPLPGGPIVLHRAGKKPVGYPALEDAFTVIQDGDVIEVRTDRKLGGSTVPPQRGAVTLRAAPGYRPVITTMVSIDAGTTLTVEGLSFSGSKPLQILGKGVPLEQQGRFARLANCAFDTAEPGNRLVSGRFQAGDGSPGEVLRCILPGLQVTLEKKTSVRIRESILTCVEVAVTESTGGDVAATIELDGCIVDWPTSPWHGNALSAWLDRRQGQCKWVARRCLFESGIPWFPSHSTWLGERNCYCFARWLDHGNHSSLAQWRAITGSPETGSVIGAPVTADPQFWRLPPGLVATGIGPDIERVARRLTPGATDGVSAQKPQ